MWYMPLDILFEREKQYMKDDKDNPKHCPVVGNGK